MELAFFENTSFNHRIFVHQKRNDVFPLHFHRDPELVYIVEGAMDVTINNEKRIITENQIVCLPSYCRHSFHTENNCLAYYLRFNPSDFKTLSPYFEHKSFDLILDKLDINEREIKPYWRDMVNAWLEAQNLLFPGFVEIIIGKLLLNYELIPTNDDKASDILIDILGYIDKHYKENITLETLADAFSYNRFYFSKLFNSMLNQSLPAYVNTVRVNRIIDIYLEKPGLNICNLAIENGFNSLSAFYRAFTDLCGVSPRKYFTEEYEKILRGERTDVYKEDNTTDKDNE